MAVLTLTARTPYTIKYVISDMTEQFVYTAKVELSLYGSSRVIRTATYKDVDVARTQSLFGYFTGLEPNTRYTIHENIFDSEGRETSSQTSDATTLGLFYGTPNTVIHSINFATKGQRADVYNTFENWGLVAAERPSVAPPTLKSKYVELPGIDGVLDYTELLIGRVPYGRRSGSWTFYTDEDKMKSLGYTWDKLYEELELTLHGKECEVSLDDDYEFFYRGRMAVNQWRSLKSFSSIVIDYNFDSFKYSYTRSDDVAWQWDDAFEEQDYQILYGSYSVQENRAINFINEGSQTITPVYEVLGNNPDQTVTVKADIGDLVQEVIAGKWGSGQDRYDRLEAAGYCWQIVQNAVNEALGSSYRFPVPPDAMTDKTQEAIDEGKLDTGTEYVLQNGTNVNNNLEIDPGDNIFVIMASNEEDYPDINTSYNRETGL